MAEQQTETDMNAILRAARGETVTATARPDETNQAVNDFIRRAGRPAKKGKAGDDGGK